MTGAGVRRKPGRSALALLGAVGLGMLASVGVSCLIPDHDIQVLTTDVNRYPVRFVEGIELSEEARCACSEASCECPMAPLTLVPPFLDPDDPAYQFCICGENKVDANRLPGVTLYVEDQDEVDGDADDPVRAAALLDWDPTLGDTAVDYVAYRNYLDPREPLALYYSPFETSVLKRPRPYLRAITLSDSEGFDLCNGAGRPVGPGFHTLSIIASDRLWFKRETQTGDTGTESMEVVQDGVPDIAAGATYDVQTYVFKCLEEGDDFCECADITDP
ncbi:hypothetical protein [Enhygromyxa salina]|uniref:hypothetical protein n=1 Tax=Enhygromyxa salina TaxID=215803 RepID=UPI0011BAB107|nr:hypothetical protein [Enhygromyxa salina]